MTNYINNQVLKWDGSDIGDITEHITGKEIISNGFKVLTLNTSNKELKITVDKYDARFIIADELKAYFGLMCNRYHIATISDQKLLIMKFEDNILFTEKYRNDKHIHLTMDDTLLTEVKKCLAFQWLLGLPIRKDRILLRTFPYVSPDVPKEIIFPTTCNERYIYSPKDIPLEPRMIKMWFGDTESFYKIILDMIEGRSMPEISSDIRDIILRYGPDHVGWKESILNQLNIVKSNFHNY